MLHFDLSQQTSGAPEIYVRLHQKSETTNVKQIKLVYH